MTADDIRQMVRVEDGGSRLCSFLASFKRVMYPEVCRLPVL